MNGYIGLYVHKQQTNLYKMNTCLSQPPIEWNDEWLCIHSFFTINKEKTEQVLHAYYETQGYLAGKQEYHLPKKMIESFRHLHFPSIVLGTIYNDWSIRMKQNTFYQENERMIDFFLSQRNVSLITMQKERTKMLQFVYFLMEELFELRSLLTATIKDVAFFLKKQAYGDNYANSLLQIFKQFYFFYEQQELAQQLAKLKTAIQHPRLATDALALSKDTINEMDTYFQKRIYESSDMRQTYRHHLNYALFTFILKTGANKKEVNQLTVNDVKEGEHVVTIFVKRGTTNQCLDIEVSKKDIQPLLDFIHFIKEHRFNCLGYRDDRVFLTVNQKELNSSEITRSLKTPSTHYSGQHLRHTYVENVIDSGLYNVKKRADIQACIKHIGNPKLVELYAFLKKQK